MIVNHSRSRVRDMAAVYESYRHNMLDAAIWYVVIGAVENEGGIARRWGDREEIRWHDILVCH